MLCIDLFFTDVLYDTVPLGRADGVRQYFRGRDGREWPHINFYFFGACDVIHNNDMYCFDPCKPSFACNSLCNTT